MEEEFIDGAFGCNNPTKQLIKEALQEFPPDSVVGCIVSIGTGRMKVSDFQKPSGFQNVLPIDLVGVLARMATDTDVIARELHARYHACPGLYHRFNVDRGLEDVSLEEWKKRGIVKTHTERYIHQEDIDRNIDAVVQAIIGKPEQTWPLSVLGR